MTPLARTLAVVLATTLGLAASPALSQTEARHMPLYRCGPDGRDLRDVPCPAGGAASSVDYDQPSAADTRAARQRQLADARQAAALDQARRASEAQARHQRAQSLGLQPQPQPAPAASAPHVAHVKPPRVHRPHRPPPAATTAPAASATH